MLLYPLSPESDEHLISPHIIHYFVIGHGYHEKCQEKSAENQLVDLRAKRVFPLWGC